MSISMRKKQGGQSRLPHIIGFAISLLLAFTVVGFLPVEAAVKKLLFFLLLIVFAILSVLIPNVIKRK